MAYLRRVYDFPATEQAAPAPHSTSEAFDFLDRPEWWAQAACLGVGPDLFYIEGRGPTHTHCRTVCQACPVQAECLLQTLLEEGLTVGAPVRHGFRGGLSPRQRTVFGRWLAKGLEIDTRKAHRHGTTWCYANGCRCPVCKAANTANVRRWRANTPTKPSAPVAVSSRARHGTRSRYVAGCRCRECTEADRAYQADRYEKRNAQRRKKAAS